MVAATAVGRARRFGRMCGLRDWPRSREWGCPLEDGRGQDGECEGAQPGHKRVGAGCGEARGARETKGGASSGLCSPRRRRCARLVVGRPSRLALAIFRWRCPSRAVCVMRVARCRPATSAEAAVHGKGPRGHAPSYRLPRSHHIAAGDFAKRSRGGLPRGGRRGKKTAAHNPMHGAEARGLGPGRARPSVRVFRVRRTVSLCLTPCGKDDAVPRVSFGWCCFCLCCTLSSSFSCRGRSLLSATSFGIRVPDTVVCTRTRAAEADLRSLRLCSPVFFSLFFLVSSVPIAFAADGSVFTSTSDFLSTIVRFFSWCFSLFKLFVRTLFSPPSESVSRFRSSTSFSSGGGDSGGGGGRPRFRSLSDFGRSSSIAPCAACG